MTDYQTNLQMVRQPVFDDSLKVVAYNLLYRGGSENETLLFGDTDFAVQVILDEYKTVFESGKRQELPAYISVPQQSVTPGWRPKFNPDNIVLDVPAVASSDYVAALRELHDAGYKISIAGSNANFDDLLDLVHTVRVDAEVADKCTLVSNLQKLRDRHNVSVLADNISTVESLEECVELGFDLFQGQFLTKPKAINEGAIGASQSSVLHLISELQNEEHTPESLAEIIQADPVFTYKLLRIVNSAAFALVREVTSVKDALVLLGRSQVRQLALIVSMGERSDKPQEMYRNLLVRGRMCEYIAEESGFEDPSAYFLMGVVSGLHLLFDTTPAKILAQINVSSSIETAVLNHEGAMGSLLKDAIGYETGAWDQLSDDLDIGLYEHAYFLAMRWMNEVTASMT